MFVQQTNKKNEYVDLLNFLYLFSFSSIVFTFISWLWSVFYFSSIFMLLFWVLFFCQGSCIEKRHYSEKSKKAYDCHCNVQYKIVDVKSSHSLFELHWKVNARNWIWYMFLEVRNYQNVCTSIFIHIHIHIIFMAFSTRCPFLWWTFNIFRWVVMGERFPFNHIFWQFCVKWLLTIFAYITIWMVELAFSD